MRHPEQRDDEAFIMNVRRDDSVRINWNTRRFGEQAFGRDGAPLPNLRPVFVKHADILRQPNGPRFKNTLQKDGYW